MSTAVRKSSKVWLRGYNSDEPKLKWIKDVARDLDFELGINYSFRRYETPISVQLPLSVRGVARPHPTLDDDLTALGGVRHRMGMLTPKINPVTLSKFALFVKKFLRDNFTPLPSDTDLSPEPWLQTTNYSESRKRDLLDLYYKRVLEPRDLILKGFMKDEAYDEFKQPRGIYSRSDRYKVEVGPVFKQIEKVVFSLPYFIKKIPVAERPNYIMDKVYREGWSYGISDYSSFEAGFKSEFMDICEMELYRYMTSELMTQEKFDSLIGNVLLGENKVAFRNFVASIMGRRMSGEMCTSLGNGFSNLMMLMFMWNEHFGNTEDFSCVVEGDDGLVAIPSASGFDMHIAAELGFIVKFEVVDAIEKASFCGILFDSVDRVNITNPLRVIADMGWGNRKYVHARQGLLMALMRSKALSYVDQYGACPIIGSAARAMLRVSRSYSIQPYLQRILNSSDEYHRERLIYSLGRERVLKSAVFEVPWRTRLLVQELYGITPEMQIHIESVFDSVHEPCEVVVPLSIFPSDWIEYFHEYQLAVPSNKNGKPIFTAHPSYQHSEALPKFMEVYLPR